MPAPTDFETDFRRLGRKWQHYLIAMRNIASTLDALALSDNPISPEEIDHLIQKTLLPELKEGSNSEAAFVADGQGRVLFTVPENSALRDKRLPFTTSAGTALFEQGKPLVVYRKEGIPSAPELVALDADSVMVVRLETPWVQRLLGVCNGRDQPEPYLSEDTQFLAPLMRVLFIGIHLGQKAAKAEMEAAKAAAEIGREKAIAKAQKDLNRKTFATQYGWARVQGEWSYLASASENFAEAQLDKSKSEEQGHE